MTPASTMTARIVTAVRRTAFEASITRRGDNRSTYTPPNSISAARGTAIMASTLPRASALPVRTRASQGSATSANWSPSDETAWPVQNRRKSRRRSGFGRAGAAADAPIDAVAPLTCSPGARPSLRPPLRAFDRRLKRRRPSATRAIRPERRAEGRLDPHTRSSNTRLSPRTGRRSDDSIKRRRGTPLTLIRPIALASARRARRPLRAAAWAPHRSGALAGRRRRMPRRPTPR